MDEILSFTARLLGSFVTEVLLSTFFYVIGWPFVKVATLGKYPDNGWLSGSDNENYVCCIGVVVFAFSLMAIFGQFSA